MASSKAEDLKSKVPWYHTTLTKIDPNMRRLLEERGVPADEVLDHVLAIREKAWSIYPYPCIGMFSFTRLPLATHPLYESSILPTLLKPGVTLLDLGCGFATDFRSLVSAGVPSTSLSALDNHDGFWNLGKDLFRDHETMNARFVVADMTDLASIPVDMLGTFDVIWAGASFHLFDWDGQVQAGIVACKLLKDRKGSAIYGYQVGRTEGKAVRSSIAQKPMFNHDPKTLEKIWREVGEQVGWKFEVQSWMDDSGLNDFKQHDPEVRRQRFAVIRVDGPDEEHMNKPTL